MGKFVGGLIIGIVMGLFLAANVFPDGFVTDSRHWIDQFRP
jgi:hypothetical protein